MGFLPTVSKKPMSKDHLQNEMLIFGAKIKK